MASGSVGLENEPIEKFLYSLTDERGYSIITANNYETVTLATVLRENTGNKDSDTDKDGITDWDEVDVEAVYNIKGDTVRGKSYLTMHDMPTIKQCLDYYDDKYFYVQSGFGIYQGEHIKRWSKYIDETKITPIISDPTNVDSDGDGLYDGQRVIYDIANSKPVFENEISDKSLITDKTKYRIMIPIDDDLMNVNDYKDAWKSQMESMKNGNIETEYTSDRGDANEVMNSIAENAYSLVNILMENDWIVNENFINLIEFMFKDSAQGNTAEEWGSDFLDFIFDKNEVAYHSQVETWQKAFGYNDLYDKVFEYGSNMLFNKIEFSYDNDEYILWSWKGDYWNLQSGGETGIYVYDRTVNNTKHYNVADFNMPMTLSLYKGSGSQMESIFNWAPIEDQWWATGFNPKFTNPDPYDMTMICSVDFETEDFFTDFIATHKPDNEKIIFDEDYKMIWIMW